MFKIKKFLIIILFILTGLYSQTRDANWILTDSENYNTLSQEAKNTISSQGKSLVDAFSKKLNINDLSVKSYYDCYWTYDKDRYASVLLSMNNPSQYEADAVKNMLSYQRCKSKTTPGFEMSDTKQKYEKSDPKINLNVSKKSTTWEEYVKFHAGGTMDYLVIAERGLEKKDLKKYEIKQEVSQEIVFDESRENGFLLTLNWVNNDGGSASKSILDYYNITDAQETVKGTFSMPKLSITDIYRMVRYWNISEERKTTYKGPQIVFNLDQSKKSFSIPLWKIADHRFAKEAQPYAKAVEAMINDVITNTPNALPYRASKKEMLVFYDYIDEDFTNLATAYINRPKKDLENLLVNMMAYIPIVGMNKEDSIEQKKAKWDQFLDSQENARALIAKGSPENFKYTNTIKRVRGKKDGMPDYDWKDLLEKETIRYTSRAIIVHMMAIGMSETKDWHDPREGQKTKYKENLKEYRKMFDTAGEKVFGVYFDGNHRPIGDFVDGVLSIYYYKANIDFYCLFDGIEKYAEEIKRGSFYDLSSDARKCSRNMVDLD